MDIKNYNSGIFSKQYGYKSFKPSYIDIEWIISDPKISNLLSSADLKLGELNAFSMLIPDVDFFIMMHITKEATQSSRIEGTQTSIEEALLKESDIDPEKRDDWSEVQNYIEAMNFAIKELENLPLSNRLLRQTHGLLLQGVRGKHKQPGEFRTSQNWIGGASISDAIFIPPHYQELPELMGDLEKFLNNEDIHVPHLIRIAIAHYQFETIHPFLDGNGRLGRLLITLYLVRYGILKKPTLYLSEFLERNKGHYYDNLMLVRSKSDLLQWLRFFLVGVHETAVRSIDTFNKILKLKDDVEGHRIVKMGKRVVLAQKLVRHLYKRPMVHASDVAENLGINITTANRLIQDFIDEHILEELTGYKRNRVFAFREYIDLFRS